MKPHTYHSYLRVSNGWQCNTPCSLCGKTRRHAIHSPQRTPTPAPESVPDAQKDLGTYGYEPTNYFDATGNVKARI